MRYKTILFMVLLIAAPASGHHSEAGIDLSSVVTFEGRVTEYTWRNPHVYLSAETTDRRGERVEWVLQMGSIVTAGRAGWGRDSLAVGDRITVRAHPALDGRAYGILESAQKDGVAIAGSAYIKPRASAAASTLEGRWMADPDVLFRYPGGLDGFFRAHLDLTEKGAAAQAAYDELSDENPDSTCLGRPTPALILSSSLFPIEIEFVDDGEVVLIRSAGTDEERTVHMDGRGHPTNERFFGGHSIGRWEGDTLIIDTANFSYHRSPYQVGVPSGPRKHVVERYRLTDDGTGMIVDFVLEDPEYIATPLTHSRELIYTPQMEMASFDCDPETARRFVP